MPKGKQYRSYQIRNMIVGFWDFQSLSRFSKQQVEYKDQEGEEEQAKHDLFQDASIKHGKEECNQAEGFRGVGGLDLRNVRRKHKIITKHDQCREESQENRLSCKCFLKGEGAKQANLTGKLVP